MQTRRQVLAQGLVGFGVIATGPAFLGCRPTMQAVDKLTPIDLERLSELLEPDEHGLRLPKGFKSRIVARSGERPTQASDYLWHGAPDGGACFATDDGGWIYVSNAELPKGEGGVGALRFDRNGEIVDAYPLLSGTNRNCAGGPTPWQTWLSGEEDEGGLIWECDPFGKNQAIARPALGAYPHEAAAYDPETKILYLTEDHPEGKFYRFVPEGFRPDGFPDLVAGRLEAMQVHADGSVRWLPVPDPSAVSELTRYQAPEATTFLGGEGIWYQHDTVYFTTKFDNKVWALDVRAMILTTVYDINTSPSRILNGVDNVVGYGQDRIVVAEDNTDREKELVILDRSGNVLPLLQILGHKDSELCGPAFDPSGSRLYFSSQRGTTGENGGGITFEVSGPFFKS